MILSRVVLPQPDGPRKHTSSPLLMTRLTSFNAVKSPNFLTICSMRKAAVPLSVMA